MYNLEKAILDEKVWIIFESHNMARRLERECPESVSISKIAGAGYRVYASSIRGVLPVILGTGEDYEVISYNSPHCAFLSQENGKIEMSFAV